MTWLALDTSMTLITALAGMACAVPGVFLVLRRQSLMGDALSHTALLGVVGAYWLTARIFAAGWIDSAQWETVLPIALTIGAAVVGVATAVLTEWVSRAGGVEESAGLGVIFTTAFALGLLLLVLMDDQRVHIDPDHVLFGQVETAALHVLPGTGTPRAVIWGGTLLLINSLLVCLAYKELRFAAFDAQAAAAAGLNVRLIYYGLMLMTSVTLVAVFEAVGSILAIAMLIVPAVTARFLTSRLSRLIMIAVAIAAASAVIGHACSIYCVPWLARLIGLDGVREANTAGMTAVVAGAAFTAAFLFGPEGGTLRNLWSSRRRFEPQNAEDPNAILAQQSAEIK
ncbi:metal ABC transporter permease [Stratiformator vulcanicus]|uniref:Manganese transport system membrane protein MntB n=1 Tax=Stratiformator vulcanicus TaxID=2527980 RepID=A0A517QZ91_9PLAN|nr:metal ABC transporter permease [Stratiformator vulcanicus]QDT36965.1 Manganese transport system membrane protein MntB [Stratiformator vulcanicus]